MGKSVMAWEKEVKGIDTKILNELAHSLTLLKCWCFFWETYSETGINAILTLIEKELKKRTKKEKKMENMIDITGVDLVAFVKKVYELSVPQGLGMFHFQEGGLSDEEAQDIVKKSNGTNTVLSLDYLHGRACKMTVFKRGEKLYIPKNWYDHTDDQLTELILTTFPKDKPFPVEHTKSEHSIACNCVECQRKRK